MVMADLYAEAVTTTARFLYHGFHVELVEQATGFYLYQANRSSEDEISSSPTFRIQSSGRRLRQQKVQVVVGIGWGAETM